MIFVYRGGKKLYGKREVFITFFPFFNLATGQRLYPLDNDNLVPEGDDLIYGPIFLSRDIPLFSNNGRAFYVSFFESIF